jgi:hypothetical protein
LGSAPRIEPAANSQETVLPATCSRSKSTVLTLRLRCLLMSRSAATHGKAVAPSTWRMFHPAAVITGPPVVVAQRWQKPERTSADTGQGPRKMSTRFNCMVDCHAYRVDYKMLGKLNSEIGEGRMMYGRCRKVKGLIGSAASLYCRAFRAGAAAWSTGEKLRNGAAAPSSNLLGFRRFQEPPTAKCRGWRPANVVDRSIVCKFSESLNEVP